MTKKNNVIEEIQELVQQIKNEYQEGVDFEIPYYSEKQKTGAIIHLSPRLKSFLRKKFDFPPALNDYLDYSKTDSNGDSNYYYRLDGEHGKKGEHEGLYWRRTNKGLEQEQPKNCKSCGGLTLEENGRMWLWNEKTVGKEFGQGSKVIAYFHPECAKKYFAGKEQPNKNNARIKDKLLRNLDKICIEQTGHLANAELLKNDEENEYFFRKGIYGSDLPEWKEWWAEINKVEIEGEEINLEELSTEDGGDYWKIREALIKEIKDSPQDWKIEEKKHTHWIEKTIRHQKTGRRHWKTLVDLKDWAEIEALTNGSPLPVENQNQTSDWKEGWIGKYFRDNGIYSITLNGDNLMIKYNDKNKKEEMMEAKTLQLKLIKEIAAQQKDCSLTFSKSPQSTNPSQSNPSKNNHHLAIGLALGAGVVILGGVIVYFVRKRNKK